MSLALTFFKGLGLVALSLIPSHLIFTIFMHSFNRKLGLTAECALRTGNLILPGPATYPTPDSWITASGSAFFFTVTLGALSFSAGSSIAGIFSGKCGRSGKFLFACLVCGIFLILMASGVPPVFAASFFVTASISGGARLLKADENHLWKKKALMMGIVCIMALAIFSFRGSGFFAGVRDGLLFGTSAGEAVIDFYYKYNLYGAEVIKKPEKRISKAVLAKDTSGSAFFEDVRRIFEEKGFAVVEGDGCPAMHEIALKNGKVEARAGDRLIAEAGLDSFRSDPSSFFRDYYSSSDNAGLLRFFIFASFFFGIPLIFTGIAADSLMVLNKAGLIGFIISFLILCSVLTIASQGFKGDYSKKDLQGMLESQKPEKRVSAMDFIIKGKLDPDSFKILEMSPGLGYPRERILYLYLSSRSGGIDRFRTISPFAGDPYPYVACQAIRFLSQLGDPRSLPVFENILRTHPNLYVQLTAMEALKSWKNRKNI